MYWLTADLKKGNENYLACCSKLKSVTFTKNETNILVDSSASLAFAGPQMPQDYAQGYLTEYSPDKWKEWLKSFELQSGVELKICTGTNHNKGANNGVLRRGSQLIPYCIAWRQQYTCNRGGKPRYKPNKQNGKPRNAPGSRLTGCTATLNVHLLKLNDGDEILIINFPLQSAHLEHSLNSIADLQSHKPLPEIVSRVESLVCNSYLSQMSLKLALKEWVNKELIPDHLKKGQLNNKPSEYDRRYYPTVQDLRNMTKSIIYKVRKNMFDQDALEYFLKEQSKDQFRYFLRKYRKATSDPTE